MDRNWKRLDRALAVVVIAMLGSTSAVQAVPVTYDLTFQTSGQSVWDAGPSNVFDRTQFLGVAWQDQGVDVNLIAGSATTNVPNPGQAAYDVGFAACRGLGFSASACINGQSFRAPVIGLGNRPSVRSCGAFAIGCQIARAGDLTRRAAYDIAFAGCQVAASATVCRNGQTGQVPVPALGTRPPSTVNLGDTRTGVALEGTSSGRVGLNVGVRMDSGSVQAEVSYAATLDIPDTAGLDRANPINFNPDSALAGGTLNTTFPTVGLTVDAVMQLSGSVTATGCILTQGCRDGTLPFAINRTAPILSFNADGEGGILLLGQTPSHFGLPAVANGFPLELSVADLATVTLHLPQADATGGLNPATQTLRARGQDDLLDLILDIDNIVATAAGLPGLFGKSFDIPVVGSVGYDIINVGMGPTIDVAQEFEFDPTLFVTLLFDQAVEIGGQIVTSFTSAWDLLPDITFLLDRTTVTPTFFVQGDLHNQTLLDFDLQFLIDLLQIHYDFGLLGSDTFGVGNVLDRAVDLFRSPNLFDEVFALQGWNVAVGDSFVIDFINGSSGPATQLAAPAPNPEVLAGVPNVPEPGTILLLAVGLLGIFGASRRRIVLRKTMPAVSVA